MPARPLCEREPEIGVQPASEQLEVVRADEEAPDGDEGEQWKRPRDRGGDPDRDGAAERDCRERDDYECLRNLAGRIESSSRYFATVRRARMMPCSWRSFSTIS